MFSSLERKHYLWATATLALLAIATAVISFFIAPKIAHGKMMNALSQAGFDTSYIAQPKFAYGAMLYSDVTFDTDAFSTIKYIKVTYNPFRLVLSGKFHDLDIIDMNITGNWSAETFGSLSFAGWKPPASLGNVPLTSFKHITISKSRLSMLTQDAGGLSVFFDGTSNRSGSKTEFQGNVKSEQKFLSVITSASGVIEGPRWYTDIEIIDGKFEEPAGDFKATRLSGWMNIANPVSEPFKIMSQLRSGGLTLYSIPWQAASSTIDYSNNELKVFTEAKSVGYDGLELELNLFKKGEANIAASGAIHADQPTVFTDYFKSREGFKAFLKDLDPYKTGSNIDIDYLLTAPRTLRYEIKQNDVSTGVTGEIKFPEPEKAP